jgi:SAM-dependent methyltransferase
LIKSLVGQSKIALVWEFLVKDIIIKRYDLFYSWQSDRPGDLCKDFIEEAFRIAILKRKESNEQRNDEWINPRSDITKRGVGMLDIPAEILESLSTSDVVVADITPVTVIPATPTREAKACANSNVLFEVGYALHAITYERIILVENEYYGSDSLAIFDIRHRQVLRYKLRPKSSEEERKMVLQELSEKLLVQLNLVLEQGKFTELDLNKQYSNWWRDQNRRRVDAEVTMEGEPVPFEVDSAVFSPDPRMTNSASLMARSIRPVDVKDKLVLDLGTGCGVLAILAAKRGAREVVAVDDLKQAVENAERNVIKHGVKKKVKVLLGNLFRPVQGQKFDLILANLPIDAEAWDHLETNVDDIARLFIETYRKCLAPHGRALLAWASFGNVELLEENMKKNRVLYRRTKTEDTFGVTWYLYELYKQKTAIPRSATSRKLDNGSARKKLDRP